MNNNYHKQKGFTLIEIVLSLAILSIIVIVFYSLFANSLIWVFRGGDRGIAYHIAQEDVENRIALREADESKDLSIVFFGKTFIIPGGLIKSEKSEGLGSSYLEAFVPYVPTISFEPPGLLEGSNSSEIEIDIEGENTNFVYGTNSAELYDKNGKVGDLDVSSVSESTHMKVIIKAYTDDPNFKLINSLNNYVIRITFQTEDGPAYARGKFVIGMPTAIAVGNNTFYSSANGLDWMDRRNSSDSADFSSLNLLDAAASNTNFIAVGNGGVVFISDNYKQWIKKNVGSSSLNTICRSENLNLFFIAGSSGRIYHSGDGNDWTSSGLSNTSEIYGIISSPDDTIIAVGETGHVFVSSSFNPISPSWNTYELSADSEIDIDTGETEDLYFDINDVSYGNGQFVAVGDEGYVYRSSDGVDWTISGPITAVVDPDDPIPSYYDLNEVYYYDEFGKFIAAGENGYIYTSDDGIDWTGNSISSNNLFGISSVHNDVDGSDYVVVVGENNIFTSENLSDWTSSIVSGQLNAVASR